MNTPLEQERLRRWRLAPGGALLLEIGLGQADAVNALLSARKFRDISVRPDYQNIPRFAVGFHG